MNILLYGCIGGLCSIYIALTYTTDYALWSLNDLQHLDWNFMLIWGIPGAILSILLAAINGRIKPERIRIR